MQPIKTYAFPRGGCGDGFLGQNELCDDGNVQDNDGCSANCQSDEKCGNRIVDRAVGEECDGPPPDPMQTCSADCKLDGCGNRIVEVDIGEVCDDGNRKSGDGCSSDCKSNETCGNGVMDINEECDIGISGPPGMPGISTAVCDADCTLPMCGDGFFNPFFIFEDPDTGIERQEECDTDGDSPICDADCTIPICGDGYTNRAIDRDGIAVEECDNGTDNSDVLPDACRQTRCRLPFCGDDVKRYGRGMRQRCR